MKNSVNFSTAELDCGKASGLLRGKGTSINTAGALQVNPFGTHWSCEAVRTSSGRLVLRAVRDGESIPTTATGSVGELGAGSVTAAMLHQPCGRSLKTTWTSSARRSWVSRRCLWLFQRELFAARVAEDRICPEALFCPGLSHWEGSTRHQRLSHPRGRLDVAVSQLWGWCVPKNGHTGTEQIKSHCTITDYQLELANKLYTSRTQQLPVLSQSSSDSWLGFQQHRGSELKPKSVPLPWNRLEALTPLWVFVRAVTHWWPVTILRQHKSPRFFFSHNWSLLIFYWIPMSIWFLTASSGPYKIVLSSLLHEIGGVQSRGTTLKDLSIQTSPIPFH